ncbi:MAG TPA: class I SAM-dependent methyltransferase [Dehalococcoidia bacterium]|nr:class I SAM-dependent methyltransferase [Dehalococcoidia bacterium]
MTEEVEYQRFKDTLRARFNRYTIKAYHTLPVLDRPFILDIGCGSGVPALELARLSNGQILGLDIDQSALDRFTKCIEEAGLSDRVKTMRRSMVDMDFADESFDVIWAEGSIAAIGFIRGLKEWRRFLKPGGFLAVHDEEGNLEEKLAQITDCGYELLDHFVLDSEIWWTEMYAPLEKHINDIRAQSGSTGVLPEAAEDQRFIEIFKKNPRRYSSVFCIIKKV